MNNFYWTPKQWADLSQQEKAIVIAGLDIRMKNEAKAQKKAEKGAKT